MEYREQFELLSVPLCFIDEELMRRVFMNGLEEEIKTEVKMMGARSLNALMMLVWKVEDQKSDLDLGFFIQMRMVSV